MVYIIKRHSFVQAKKLGVQIKPSTNPKKKIDVFKKGKKVASIGAIGYNDYPTYLKFEKMGVVPKGTANKKRKAYKKRHQQHRNKKGTPSFYADKILW